MTHPNRRSFVLKRNKQKDSLFSAFVSDFHIRQERVYSSVYFKLKIDRPMPAISKREQIVAEALRLFYRDGFNATGIDKICKEAGVSKKTLYNHYRSKDELILATLRLRDEAFRNKFMRETERLGKTSKERLLSLFDVLAAWTEEKDFHGCMFINASAEFSEKNNPIHLFSAEHKRLMREYIRELAENAGARNPKQLASQLNLLLEGAIVEAHVSDNQEAAELAKTMAQIVIEHSFD